MCFFGMGGNKIGSEGIDVLGVIWEVVYMCCIVCVCDVFCVNVCWYLGWGGIDVSVCMYLEKFVWYDG